MTNTSTTADTRRPPRAGTWYVDPWHTSATFAAVNRGAGRVRGRFNKISGVVQATESTSASTVVAVIDTTSVSTGVARRDGDLQSPTYLDAANYPEMRYAGTGLDLDDRDAGTMSGELTLHGVTRRCSLHVRWLGFAPDPFSKDAGEHAAFAARGTIRLGDFGINPGFVPGLAIRLVGDEVAIELEVILLPYDPAPLLADIPVE